MEIGRNPVIKHQIQPEYGDEQADAGRECQTVSRDQILRRERGQGKISFPCSALTTSAIGNLIRLIHDYSTCYVCNNTYIHSNKFCIKFYALTTFLYKNSCTNFVPPSYHLFHVERRGTVYPVLAVCIFVLEFHFLPCSYFLYFSTLFTVIIV